MSWAFCVIKFYLCPDTGAKIFLLLLDSNFMLQVIMRLSMQGFLSQGF